MMERYLKREVLPGLFAFVEELRAIAGDLTPEDEDQVTAVLDAMDSEYDRAADNPILLIDPPPRGDLYAESRELGATLPFRLCAFQ